MMNKNMTTTTYWQYDEDAKEWTYESSVISASYTIIGDGNVQLTISSKSDIEVKTEEVIVPREVADFIIGDIESNHDDYFIRVYDFQNGRGELHMLYHLLDNMPFDKNGVHATGVEYLETNGDWIIKYEDDEDYDFIVKEVKF